MAQAGVRRRLALAVIPVLAFCGCADGASGPSAEGGRAPPLRIIPGSLELPPPGPSRPFLRDTCGAATLAGLLGRPRTQIPVPVDLTRRRVACTACPVAPDVRLDRVNILFDARTGIVTKITCG